MILATIYQLIYYQYQKNQIIFIIMNLRNIKNDDHRYQQDSTKVSFHNLESCESHLQKKQKYAKNNLFQLDDNQKYQNQSYCNKPTNIINGWTEQIQSYKQKYKQLCSKQYQIKRHDSSLHKMRIKTQETQNCIPKLKELLVKLESPQNDEYQPNFKLAHLQLLKDLKQKKKQSLKIYEIKTNDNKNQTSKKNVYQNMNQPFTNSLSRLNTNIILKTSEVNNPKQRLKTIDRLQLQTIQQNQIIKLIKKKREQMKELKKLKQSEQNLIPSIAIKKEVKYIKCQFNKQKKRDKLTLTNLIRL